ncbi:hypothetical protein ACFSJY_06420 [Thalassotalea euphylliae]|uniref:hypothetical protein n=1 Tax=Thalassotalea euphylliae TaxID=1655234 RepID=UPI00362EF8AB
MFVKLKFAWEGENLTGVCDAKELTDKNNHDKLTVLCPDRGGYLQVPFSTIIDKENVEQWQTAVG